MKWVFAVVLFIAVICFLISFFILKDPKLHDVGIHLAAAGIGFITGDLVGLAFHYFSSRESTELVMKRLLAGFEGLDENSQIAAIGRVVGDRQIAKEIVHALIRNRLYYSDWEVKIELAELDPSVHAAEDCERFVHLKASYDVTINNPNTIPVTYPFRPVLSDIKKPEKGVYTFDQLEFAPLDSRNKPTGDKMVLTRVDLEREASYSADKREARRPNDFELGANQSAKLTLVINGFEMKHDGYYHLQTRHSAVNMTLQIAFPGPGYQPAFYFSHMKGGNDSVCKQTLEAQSATATIEGGILPYQGILCTWKKT